jgi:hypothetical protein
MYKGRTLAADWSLSKRAYTTQAGKADGEAPAAHDGEIHGSVEGAAPDTAAPGDSGDGKASAHPAKHTSEQSSDSSDSTELPAGAAGLEVAASDDAAEPAAAAGEGGSAGVTEQEHAMLARVLQTVVGKPEARAAGSAKAPGAKEAASEAKVKKRKAGQDADQAGDSKAGPETWEGAQSVAEQSALKSGSGVIQAQVFVRGVPLDATKIELQARLQRFGDVKACRCARPPPRPACASTT